jgi:hypothetical protein
VVGMRRRRVDRVERAGRKGGKRCPNQCLSFPTKTVVPCPVRAASHLPPSRFTMTKRARVQLGFAVPLALGMDSNDHDDAGTDPEILGHRDPCWSDWDGGKIGGLPSWLNPRDLPGESPLRCRGPCGDDNGGNERDGDGGGGTAMGFVVQIYCPADDDASNDAAYHRSLYVFACPTCCRAASLLPPPPPDGTEESNDRRRLLSNCVRVLRCQLPKHNDFYPPTCDDLDKCDVDWTRHTSRYWSDVAGDDTLNLCAASGQRRAVGNGKLQKQDWRGDRRSRSVPVYRESELAVEEEPRPSEGSDDTAAGHGKDDRDDNDVSSAKSKIGSALFPNAGAAVGIDDADADLTQFDLNAMTGNMSLTGVTDPVTLAFYHRMNVGEDNDVRGQCLRYNRWPDVVKVDDEGVEEEAYKYDDACGDDMGDGPLWLSSNDRPPIGNMDDALFPPPCKYCGARRDFEFQILPQMLSCLMPNPPLDADDVPSASNRSKATTTSESDLAILMEAHSMIESGMDLPSGFRESHEVAVANARRRLLSGAGGVDGLEGSSLGVDWGVIAVYTCTASCGDGGIVCEESGCYREEVAWLQPPLD